MNFKELNNKTIRAAFVDFDTMNPRVYQAFRAQALKALRAGSTKISSKAIVNWMRWEMFLQTNDKDFKINDAFTAHYARKFIREFPEHIDKFEVRKLRTEEDGPYMFVDENNQLSFL